MKNFLFLFAFILLHCRHVAEYQFEGKWQSLNDPTTVIEFFPDGGIDLFKSGMSFWEQTMKSGKLKYKLKNIEPQWYDLDIQMGSEKFLDGRIEIVSPERIRVYLHKHHDILDLADEYYRTYDFTSFQEIMSEINSHLE